MIRPTAARRRRGAALILAMVCLVVVGLIAAALLRQESARRRQVRMDERRLQAAWLAESGLERASARLARDPDYAGETWEVPAEALGGRGPGVVRIAVEPVADRPGPRLALVVAEFPAGADLHARSSLAATITPRTEPTGDRR